MRIILFDFESLSGNTSGFSSFPRTLETNYGHQSKDQSSMNILMNKMNEPSSDQLGLVTSLLLCGWLLLRLPTMLTLAAYYA